MKKLNRSNISQGLLALGLAMGAVMVHADEVKSNVYVGGNVSFNRTGDMGASVDGAMLSQGLGSSSSTDKSSTNPDLRIGYQINSNFAIEGSYDRLGKLNVQSAITSPTADTANGTWQSRGLGLHALAIAPIDKQWSIYGRVGFEQWRSQTNLVSNAGGSTNVSTSAGNTSFVLGAGTSYAMSSNLDATGEYIRYTRVGDSATTGSTPVNQFSLGLRYHFL